MSDPVFAECSNCGQMQFGLRKEGAKIIAVCISCYHEESLTDQPEVPKIVVRCWNCHNPYTEKPKSDGGGRYVYNCTNCGKQDDEEDMEEDDDE